MTETNPILSSFLIGKFNRETLHDVLAGMRLSDISGLEMQDFIACLNQKDRLIGVRLWAEVLLPIRNAWQDWKELEAGFISAQKQLTDRLTEVRARIINTHGS